MSKLDDLIAELCPDGVEYKSLEEVINYEQPTKYIVESTNYNNDFAIPVLTAGASFVLGYTDETEGLYSASEKCPVIIFDDFTTSFHWVDFSFKVKSSAMKLLTAKNESIATLRYLYFAMKCIPFTPSQHARHWIQIYSKFLVPIPPLPIQQEIVLILDKFTALEAELEAELEARKKQYEYYRDMLLAANDAENWTTLGKIGTNIDYMRKPVTKSARESGKFPYYGASGIVDFVSDYIFDGDYLLVSEDGANLLARKTPIAFSISGKTWVNNHAHIIKFENKVTQRFVELYLNSIDLSKYINTAAQPKITQANLNSIEIPVPPLAEQERIVVILDRFDALVNDITQGLPAEIAARQMQYEYYRDKLLTFKEKVS